jgi:hypothetical protein
LLHLLRARDRNRPALAVGKGFPFPLFRLRNGFTVLPWRTFAYEPGSSCASGKNIRFPAGRRWDSALRSRAICRRKYANSRCGNSGGVSEVGGS